MVRHIYRLSLGQELLTTSLAAETATRALTLTVRDCRSSFIELVDAWHSHGHADSHFTSGMGLHFYLAQTPIVVGSSHERYRCESFCGPCDSDGSAGQRRGR